jgi:hypothetical protein
MIHVYDRTVACNRYVIADADAVMANNMNILLDVRLITYCQVWDSGLAGSNDLEPNPIPNGDPIAYEDVFGMKYKKRTSNERIFAKFPKDEPVQNQPFQSVIKIAGAMQLVQEGGTPESLKFLPHSGSCCLHP